ncbi:MAG: DUF1800 domain-containing protein [Chloroflexales bacterium]|nr:DUF1800 domain-containing protein [Chloroflexales bacterium]
MALSRRRLFQSSAALSVVAGIETVSAPASPVGAQSPAASPAAPLFQAPAASSLPEPEIIALNRMGYGPRQGDAERVKQIGLPAYIDEQLNPTAINDSACDTLLNNARLRIRYGTAPSEVNEARALTTLGQEVQQLWAERVNSDAAYQEWVRPADEVKLAAWIRAVHSKRQLQELLVEFWHNHFNVSAYSDRVISATFPAYDRIMRTHCLGNFRAFVEAIGRSAAMMHYLDNASNRAGGGEGGNENYARELIELHTLGSDNYLKFYDKRGKIPLITYKGKDYPRGYVDDDVYEAARALTGWTNANGYWDGKDADDGSFLFREDWHDGAAKTVLAPKPIANRDDIGPEPNVYNKLDPLKEGQAVFDLLAGHPGTARNVCTKLCRRLLADEPPLAVIDAAVDVWMANVGAADQLKQVVRVILISNEFKTTWGQKVKRPFEAIVSFLRATDATLPVDTFDPAKPNEGGYWSGLWYLYGFGGQRLFEWATPTGHPDRASYWITTNSMLRRWNMPYNVTQSWGGGVTVNLKAITDAAVPGGSCVQVVDYWIKRLCGFTINTGARQSLIDFLAMNGDPNKTPKASAGEDPTDASVLIDRINSTVQLLAMTPDFYAR